jgi:hypothetical protein
MSSAAHTIAIFDFLLQLEVFRFADVDQIALACTENGMIPSRTNSVARQSSKNFPFVPTIVL